MIKTRQPTNVTELRRHLRRRRVHVALPMGSTTALVHTTVEEAVRLWRFAGVALSPRRVLLDTDDRLLIDLAVLDFSGRQCPSPRVQIGPDGQARIVQPEAGR